MRCYAVADTNATVTALITKNSDSPPRQVFRAMLSGDIIPLYHSDILSEYEGRFPDKIRKDQQPARMTLSPEEFQNASPEDRTPSSKVAQKPLIPGQDENLKKDLDKKVIDKEQSASYSDVNDISKSLSDDEQVILAALDTEPRLAAMTMLALKGILRRLPGKRVALTDAKQSQ